MALDIFDNAESITQSLKPQRIKIRKPMDSDIFPVIRKLASGVVRRNDVYIHAFFNQPSGKMVYKNTGRIPFEPWKGCG